MEKTQEFQFGIIDDTAANMMEHDFKEADYQRDVGRIDTAEKLVADLG